MSTLTWTGSGNNGNWNDPKNWIGGSQGQVPGTGDTIVINTSVTLSSGPNLNNGTLTIQTTKPGSSITFANSNFNGTTIVVNGPVGATFINGDNMNNATIHAQNGGQINIGNPGGSGGSPGMNGAVLQADAGSAINVNAQIISDPGKIELLLKGGTLNDNVSKNGSVSLFQQPLQKNATPPINLGNDPNSTIHYGGAGTVPVSGYLGLINSSGNPSGSNGSAQINCFLAGTLIETETGPVAVENIHIGDAVMAMVDGARVPRRVVWTGMQRVDAGPNSRPGGGFYPVRIRQDALAMGVPTRDLLMTPEHCVFIEGRLIPIRMLINGRSIDYDMSLARFDHYHVETEEHSIVLAEGMPAESFLDTGNRRAFIQTGRVVPLHGEAKNWVRDAAAPLATDQATVEPIFRQLEARAIAAGLARSGGERVLTEDPDLRLLTDTGQFLRPIAQEGRRVVFALPERTAMVRILSRAARPSEVVGPFLDDRRNLGVLVGEVAVYERSYRYRRRIVAHLTTELAGWHPSESASCRWTTGNAMLPLREEEGLEPAIVEIEIRAAGPYPVAPQSEAPARAARRA